MFDEVRDQPKWDRVSDIAKGEVYSGVSLL